MKTRYLVLLILGFAANPALADKFFAVTPSGAAEIMFADKPLAVVCALSSKCIDVRQPVTSSTLNELVCGAPLNSEQSMLGQLMMGNTYLTPPRGFFFLIWQRIVACHEFKHRIELQMAFGQLKRTDFVGPEFQNNIINFMTQAGGKLPLRTSFPNHAALGVQTVDASLAKGRGLRVTSIVPGSAAEKAGIQIGDTVTGIAHRRFKNSGVCFDAATKAAETPTYEIEILRSGAELKLNVDRQFRPNITEAVTAKFESIGQPSQPYTLLSTAQEIAKLAKLRDEGILTNDEFMAQKRRMLSESPPRE